MDQSVPKTAGMPRRSVPPDSAASLRRGTSYRTLILAVPYEKSLKAGRPA
jgi:hypothetical protein